MLRDSESPIRVIFINLLMRETFCVSVCIRSFINYLNAACRTSLAIRSVQDEDKFTAIYLWLKNPAIATNIALPLWFNVNFHEYFHFCQTRQSTKFDLHCLDYLDV